MIFELNFFSNVFILLLFKVCFSCITKFDILHLHFQFIQSIFISKYFLISHLWIIYKYFYLISFFSGKFCPIYYILYHYNFWNMLGLVLWLNLWSIFEKVPWAFENNIFSICWKMSRKSYCSDHISFWRMHRIIESAKFSERLCFDFVRSYLFQFCPYPWRIVLTPSVCPGALSMCFSPIF